MARWTDRTRKRAASAPVVEMFGPGSEGIAPVMPEGEDWRKARQIISLCYEARELVSNLITVALS